MSIPQAQIDLYNRCNELSKELCDVIYDIDFFNNFIEWLRSGNDYNSAKINLTTSVRIRLDYLNEKRNKLEAELKSISDQDERKIK